MLIKDFETKLKAIDPKFEVKDTGKDDIKAIWWNGKNAYVTIPSTEIFETRNPSYQDAVGQIHRTIDEAIDLALLRRSDIIRTPNWDEE